jgi:hypothetical protein
LVALQEFVVGYFTMEDALASIGTDDPVAFSADHYADLQVTPVQAKKPSKRPRNGAASGTDANRREYYEWSDGAVHSLLDIYEEKYSALQRGNLRGRHWHEVAHHVSSREDGTRSAKTSKQCKMKIENLKRRYKVSPLVTFVQNYLRFCLICLLGCLRRSGICFKAEGLFLYLSSSFLHESNKETGFFESGA